MPGSLADYCNSINDDTVFWCMGDEPVVGLAMNWVASCERVGIKPLFVALDLQTYHIMQSRTPTVFMPQGNWHVFVNKFVIGAELMRLGKNWFYTDVDCVAHNDYRPIVKDMFANGADQICQAVKHYQWLGEPIPKHGEYNCGTGMYGMRVSETNIAMCSIESLDANGYTDDGTCQKHVNTTIKHRADTDVQLLDPMLFPEGNSFEDADENWNIFHITGKYAYEDWDNTKEYLGDSAKMDSLKKLGLWYL